MFKGFFVSSGHSGFRYGIGKTGKTLQKGCFFLLLFPREIQGIPGNKVENDIFPLFHLSITVSLIDNCFTYQ